MLRFSPNEHYESLANFVAPKYLAKQVSLRNTTADIAGGPNREWLNTILNSSLPPSKRPRAVHFFAPAAASWHVHVTHYQEEEFLDPREAKSAHVQRRRHAWLGMRVATLNSAKPRCLTTPWF